MGGRVGPTTRAWIDELRSEGKRTALVYGGEGAGRALEIAGIGDRFDAISMGPRSAETIERAFESMPSRPTAASSSTWSRPG